MIHFFNFRPTTLALTCTALLGGASAVLAQGAAPASRPESKVAQPEKKPEAKAWNVNEAPGQPGGGHHRHAHGHLDERGRVAGWQDPGLRPALATCTSCPSRAAKPRPSPTPWPGTCSRASPDGQRIAYVSDEGGGDNIWVMDVDGGNRRQITKEDFRLMNNPAWHPSGKYLVARKHFTGSRSLGSGEIWLYDLDGGKGVQLNDKPNWQKDLGEPPTRLTASMCTSRPTRRPAVRSNTTATPAKASSRSTAST